MLHFIDLCKFLAYLIDLSRIFYGTDGKCGGKIIISALLRQLCCCLHSKPITFETPFSSLRYILQPLKNAGKINEIGQELAQIYKVEHLPSDFKKKNGYKRSIELSHEYGLYRQNYCGCVFSKRESIEREKQKQQNGLMQ